MPTATEPDRWMTPEAIATALARMVPNALTLLERSMREVSKPSRAALDSAWRLIDLGLAVEPEAEVVDRDVAELATVLSLVTGR